MFIKRSCRLFRTVCNINSEQLRERQFTVVFNVPNIMSELRVEHDTNSKEFFVKLPGDNLAEKAVLQYSWVKPDTADLFHTEVPPVFRGKGIAKYLAKAALDYIVEKDAKMILSCTYLQKYVKDNPLPEYTSRVVGPKL